MSQTISMWQCHYCQKALSLEEQMKNRLCPSCGSDLRACLNCLHYDESLAAKCREPESPWVQDRQRHNDCPFFEPRAMSDLPSKNALQQSEIEKAKAAFKALFRTS